jgi:hypothetical protein
MFKTVSIFMVLFLDSVLIGQPISSEGRSRTLKVQSPSLVVLGSGQTDTNRRKGWLSISDSDGLVDLRAGLLFIEEEPCKGT